MADLSRLAFVAVVCCALALPSLSQESARRLHVAPAENHPLRTLDSAGTVFVSLNDLASVLRLSVFVNDSTGKIEMRLASYIVKFTRRSPFVVITGLGTGNVSIYQLPSEVVRRGPVFFIRLDALTMVWERVWPGGLITDPETGTLTMGPPAAVQAFDVTGVEIEQRLNGYLMTILASRKLGDVEAWLKPDGWLFVTIANAKADTVALKKVKPVGAVRSLLTFQSPTSVQLTFKVAPDVEQAEVIPDPATNNLLVTLRTRSEAERRALEKKKQDLARKDLDNARSRWNLDVIVIDAGHGGKDPGAIGLSGVHEKTITLGIARKLGALIEKNMKDVKVVYTRKTDTFVELYRRTQIANEAGGKLFISIHCNSREQKPSRANGFEIYLLRPGRTEDAINIAARENAVIQFEEGYEQRYKKLTEEEFIIVTMAQSSYMKYSERFAELATQSMARRLSMRNSGVKQAGFYVLVGASMPNVLVETGYISNKKDETLLRSTSGQQKIAEAIFEGVREYKDVYERGLRDHPPETGQ